MGAMLLSVLSRTLLFVVLIIGNLVAASGETAASPNASVYIISPKDGDTVTNPFRVQFGLSDMGVAPAGVDKPNSGHHHLLIDVNEPLNLNEPHKTKHIFISVQDKLKRLLNCLQANTRFSLCWGTGRIFRSIRPLCRTSLLSL
jgi:Domain of unknown function (DUF4399)